MSKRIAAISILSLIPLSVFAAPKVKETIALQVVTSKTRINSSSARNIFTYTDLMFTQFNGKRIVYQCVQRGDICPMMQSGNNYTAGRDGIFIYISMGLPDDNKALSVKYKQVGTW
jgi:hypothetical protein